MSFPDVNKIVDILCEDLPQITKQKVLGEGAEGVVYEWCIDSKNCDYVVKIREYTGEKSISETMDDIKEEMRKTNKMNMYGLAPKIYQVKQCTIEDRTVFLILMDKVKGITLSHYIVDNKFTLNQFDLFLRHVHCMHTVLGEYHGDLNSPNIFFDGDKKFTFIDFTLREKSYEMYHDYLTFLINLPFLLIGTLKKSNNKKKVMNFYRGMIECMAIAIRSEFSDDVNDTCIKEILEICDVIKISDKEFKQQLQKIGKIAGQVNLNVAICVKMSRDEWFQTYTGKTYKEMKNITELNLSNKGILEITPLSRLKKLKVLILDNNKIDDITPLAKLPLVELSLANNKIDDIAVLPEMKDLKILSLENNRIAFVYPLTKLTYLEHLNISGNRVDIKSLQKKLPQTNIT